MRLLIVGVILITLLFSMVGIGVEATDASPNIGSILIYLLADFSLIFSGIFIVGVSK